MIDRSNAYNTALNVVLNRRITSLMNILRYKEITFEEWLDKYEEYESYKAIPQLDFLEANKLVIKLAIMLRDAEVIIKGKKEEQQYQFELEALKEDIGPIRSMK